MTKKFTFTTQFNRSDESIRDTSVQEFTQPSMVKESLSYAVDINTIYDSFCKTGKVPLNGQQPIYDENFVNYDSLVEAQKLVDEASKYFQNLPTDIKSAYGNSLEKFVKGLNAGDQYLQDKGVLVKPQVDPPSVIEPSVGDTTVTPSTPSQPSAEVPATPAGATA